MKEVKDMEQITEFIKPELLVLIPALYFIGVAIVKSTTKNKFIPFILIGVGIVLCGLWVFATSEIATSKDIALAIFTAIVQGVLVAAGAVLANETAKQVKK